MNQSMFREKKKESYSHFNVSFHFHNYEMVIIISGTVIKLH